ncbi:trypsin-like peptidase domain-containing protein [Leucobacter albus]|uniref:Trypsin-like peptidase domain-containing protein n=1 Tax=Leucobacter albus TaxID=272210 RepID=A0ABW3TI60_9MICO
MAENTLPPSAGATPTGPEDGQGPSQHDDARQDAPQPNPSAGELGGYPAPGSTPAPAAQTPEVGVPANGLPGVPANGLPGVPANGLPGVPTNLGARQQSREQQAPYQQGTHDHPTVPLHDAFGQPLPGQPLPGDQHPGQAQPGQSHAGQQFAGHPGPQGKPATTKRGHSTGTFLAGLAVAALIGGIVGGGVSSLVMANAAPKGGQVSQQPGTVTLNNPETATEISGVAAVGTPSVVTISVESQTEAGSGSGVIYSEDGYIITNAHVVTLDGAAADPRIRVKHSDGRVFEGKLVGVAPYSDIAVVKVEAENLTPIAVADSSKVNVGDLAVAIGAPMSLSNTVTSGVVSALNRGISVGSALIPQDPSQEGQEDQGGEGEQDGGGGFPWDFRFDRPGEPETQQQTGGQVTLPVVQTDASINPGNSGGALLNARAELIGINVAIASPGATEGNASSAGLGFAIPADLATRVADEIIAGEKPSHGMLGASVADSSLDDDEDANHAGGLIKEIVRGGAAANAGLKVGDVITAVDGVPAADGTSVSALIRMHAGDSEVTIDYTRQGVAGQVEAKLGTLDW